MRCHDFEIYGKNGVPVSWWAESEAVRQKVVEQTPYLAELPCRIGSHPLETSAQDVHKEYST